MNIDDKLSQIFDIEPISETKSELITVDNKSEAPKDEAIETDYNHIRGNLYTLLQNGQDALMHALEVAKQSEHPRAFEVVSGLMKDLAEINGRLMDLHKKKQALDTPSIKAQESQNSNVTNNAIFVGSTSDLSKMLGELKKGN